jgi:carbonic anhydrase
LKTQRRSDVITGSRPHYILIALLAAVLLGGLASLPFGCTSPTLSGLNSGDTVTMSQEKQSAITPDDALVRLKTGNLRFVKGESLRRDYPAQVKATAGGQYPFAIVLSCLDSRSSPEIVFDQGIGDIFVARVAGNYATTDIIGSMEFGANVAGAKLIVVMGHSECGAIKGACDDVRLGNLTTVIQSLHPAVEDVKDQGDRSSKNKAFVQMVAEANVRRTVAKIRADSSILRDMERAGKIKIVGAMNDLSTGEVKFIE